jgi:NADH-quinone oxidoreductase subunit E
LCTFREIERQIAGLHDDAAIAIEANGSGAPTEVGVKVAIERGDTAPSYAVENQPAPGKKAPAKKAAAKKQQPSAHDAPLKTSASDTSHPSGEGKK